MFLIALTLLNGVSASGWSCSEDTISNGVGPVYRLSYQECKDKFKGKVAAFVYHHHSRYCQQTTYLPGVNVERKDVGWSRCVDSAELNPAPECDWVAVKKWECPSYDTITYLEDCRTNMSDGQLCQADGTLPNGNPNFEVNNCIYGLDVFRYVCRKGIWINGWCESSPGVDANGATVDLGKGFDTKTCLDYCSRRPYTACEWNQRHRTCIRHTEKVTAASGKKKYRCYIPTVRSEEGVASQMNQNERLRHANKVLLKTLEALSAN